LDNEKENEKEKYKEEIIREVEIIMTQNFCASLEQRIIKNQIQNEVLTEMLEAYESMLKKK